MNIAPSQFQRIASKPISQLNQINHFYSLRKSQWLTRSQLQKLQEKKLRNIIKHCYKHVKYYNQLFKSLNLHPADIKNIEDLNKIPILTKSKIQNSPEKLISNNLLLKDCYFTRTSGSTGIPLKIIIDENTHTCIGSRQLRYYSACGVKPRDTISTFSAPHHFNKSKSWINLLGFFKKQNYSVFDPIDNHIKQLLLRNPDVIQAYPSILSLIAQRIEETLIHKINPRLIITTSESMSQALRKKINSAFQSEIFDQYGSTEFGTFAWECSEHNGYHIDIEDCIVEFLNNGEAVSPGENGEIVVTSLSNYAMPLIRYSLGDIGTPSNEKCSCGRGLPLIKKINGRIDDFLTLPSGQLLSPRNLGTLEYIEGIAKFRIIQEYKDKIIVQVVKGAYFCAKTVKQIQSNILQGCLGENLQIIVETVEDIPRDKSGKQRMILSKVTK